MTSRPTTRTRKGRPHSPHSSRVSQRPCAPRAPRAQRPRAPRALLAAPIFLAGFMVQPHGAEAQDLRQLTQQVRALEEQSSRELQLARSAQAEAVARVTALEADKATLMTQVSTLLTRLDQLEEETRARGGPAQTSGQETSRGFEPSGSGWRFAVGSSFLEISENGVELRSGGDLRIAGSQRLDLRGGQDTTLEAGLDLKLESGMGLGLQSGMDFSLDAGGMVSLQNSAGSRLGLQGSIVSLFGPFVQLGSPTDLRSVAHVDSSVVASGGSGTVISGSSKVMVGK